MLALAVVLVALQQPAPPASALPPQAGDTSPFRRLALPAPNLMREGSGRPGPRYWQQRADYTVRTALDTATHTIASTATIRYANNSPDTLGYLWLQLDQNIYRADSRGAAVNPTDARFSGRGFEGGYTIAYVRAVRGGRSGGQAGKTPLATTLNGTMMRVNLDRPLGHGQVASLELGYSFEVPEHGSDRMGRERYPGGWLYEVAQWYPRVAVYDDVRGWNTEQYLGQGEFYLEYGDFDVAITVPRSFVVAATGTLANPLDVLTATQRARLVQAAKSDTTVPVGAARPVRRDDPRAGASMVPDDRRVERAAVRVDGRGVQQLHQHLLGAGLLPRHDPHGARRRCAVGQVRRHRPRRAAHPRRRPRGAATPRPGRVQQAGYRAVPAAPPHPRRHHPVRRGVPRIHPALGVPAPDPG